MFDFNALAIKRNAHAIYIWRITGIPKIPTRIYFIPVRRSRIRQQDVVVLTILMTLRRFSASFEKIDRSIDFPKECLRIFAGITRAEVTKGRKEKKRNTWENVTRRSRKSERKSWILWSFYIQKKINKISGLTEYDELFRVYNYDNDILVAIIDFKILGNR